MFSRVIINTATVVLAASGLGALCGGASAKLLFGRRHDFEGSTAEAVRNGGYIGGTVGLLAVLGDLILRHEHFSDDIRFLTALVFGPGAVMLAMFAIFKPSDLVAGIVFGVFTVSVFVIAFWCLEKDHRLPKEQKRGSAQRT